MSKYSKLNSFFEAQMDPDAICQEIVDRDDSMTPEQIQVIVDVIVEANEEVRQMMQLWKHFNDACKNISKKKSVINMPIPEYGDG